MRHRRQFAGSPFFYGAPYFYSDYYEPYEPEYPAPEPPPPPAPAVQVKNEPLPDPVLLELRSGQWVRVTNFGETSERALSAGAQGSWTFGEGLLERYGIDACILELNCDWIEGLRKVPFGSDWELLGRQMAEVFFRYFAG